MPDVSLPMWLNGLLIVGVAAGALTAIIVLSVKVVSGLGWLGKTTQTAILAPTVADIDRLERKLDQISDQLTGMSQGFNAHAADTYAHHKRQDEERSAS